MPTGRRRTEGPHYRSGHRLGGVGLRSKSPWHHGGHGVVDIVGPVAPPGRASGRGDSQECTQIGGNGPSAPFRGIRVHCCAVGLGCGWPWDRNSVHRSPKTAYQRHFGAFVYTVATRAAPGGTSASTTMACRLRLLAGPSRLGGKTGSARVALPLAASSPRRQPTRTPEELRITALRGFWWVARAGMERKRGRRAIAPQPGEDRGGEVLYVAKASGYPLDGPCESLPLEVGVGGPAAEVAGDLLSPLPDRPGDRPRLGDVRVAPFGRRSRRASVPPLLPSPVRRHRASPRSSGRSGPS